MKDVEVDARTARDRVGSELEEAIMTWTDKVRAEGEARGELMGRAETLLELLALEFGPLAPDVSARVRAMGTAELGRLAERLFTATTLDDALG